MKTETQIKDKLKELKQSENNCIQQLQAGRNQLILLEKNLEQIRGAISITTEYLTVENDIEKKKKEVK